MLNYEIMSPAEKFFKKLKKTDPVLLKKYKEAIDQIRATPYIGSYKNGDLKGYMGYDILHNKTNYEMAYVIGKNQDGDLIVVVMAGTRENFYDELKLYNKSNSSKIKKLHSSK